MNLDHHESEGASRGSRRRHLLLCVVAVLATGGVLGLELDYARAESNPVVVIDGLGQFEVLSYSWGSSSSGAAQSGAPSSKVQDLSFTKNVDGVSSALSTAAASGQVFSSASITVAGKNGKLVRYEMTNVFVSAYSLGSGTPTATENVSLRFASVKAVHR
jgi:type VI protein secretion system component Hcp